MNTVLQRRSTDEVHDDVRLRDRLVFGDESAFLEIYALYSGLVHATAARVTRDPRAAEDVTQEVFLTIWQNPFAYDAERGSLRGWLAMIARRRAIDLVRREEGHRRVRMFAAEMVPGDPVGDEVSDIDAAARVTRAVRQLPATLRHAVILAYFHGRTYREVAQDLGLPEGTAKSRLREGLRRLAVIMQGAGEHDAEAQP